MVCKEVGSLSEARRMPTEVRRWWLDRIVEESQKREDYVNGLTHGKGAPPPR